jgi:crotonobetainyl-CoA:carnitine CoA-transferase CaiB-like acyl-CoA transferase
MSGILTGVTVLELAGLGPVPFCGTLLADLGAEVIVIDRVDAAKRKPDPSARLMNRGKRSVTLDLKSAEGVELALKIGARCDALIEGMRPGVAERLGLGPQAFKKLNPKLVYGRMTGWGQCGPLASAPGHDINYISLSGAAWFGGTAGLPPVPSPTLPGDLGGGAMYLVVGLLAGLLNARSSGTGQVVDAAIVDGSAHLTMLLLSLRAAGQLPDERGRSWIDGSPWYRCYACKDGKFVSVGALEPQFFSALMIGMGLQEEFPASSQFDQSTWPQMERRMSELFANATRDWWCERLEGTDACFAPVLTPGEAVQHPHNVARGIYSTDRGFLEAAPAPRFSGFPNRLSVSEAPSPGQHTEDILRELGFGIAELDALRAKAVI